MMKKQATITTDEPFYCESTLGINDFWSFSAQNNGKHLLDTYCDSKEEAESLKTYLEAMPDFAKLMEVYNEFRNASDSVQTSKKHRELFEQLDKLNEILCDQ